MDYQYFHQSGFKSNISIPQSDHHTSNIIIEKGIHFENTISQTIANSIRPYMNGYPQNLVGCYDNPIGFIDSPPNSEESWPDEPSKESPGPQIIDVQTLYPNNSNSRKRRMDWDPLDIDQSDSTGSGTITNAPNSGSSQEKDKNKREKLSSGRGNWAEEIGFDLSADFNGNSYLNNDTFLSFSSGLSALKQEPQTDHLKVNKSSLNSIHTKIDKSPLHSNDNSGNGNGSGITESNLTATPSTATTVNSGSCGGIGTSGGNSNGSNANTVVNGSSTANTQNINDGRSKNDLKDSIKYSQQQQQQQQGGGGGGGGGAAGGANNSRATHQGNFSNENGLLNCQNTNTSNSNNNTNNSINNNNTNNHNNNNNNNRQIDSDNYSGCSNNNSNNNSGLIQQISVADSSKLDGSANGSTAHADEHKFQYILAAATSIATKNNEETLTYLNQGQSYEIKLKKIGDLSFYRDKVVKSVIKICFHERRLQFMEREQMQQWQASRPGERIIEVDIPLSYGLCHVTQPSNSNLLNTIEVFWDPFKEVGVYIKVNCISTEFTPKKHGGEKGVPFRLQIETYIESSNSNWSTNNNTNNNNNLATSTNNSSATQSQNLITSTNNSGGNGSNTATGNGGNLTPNHKLSCLPLVGGKQPVHAAACQIKVFKLKGADRKHKQDREKIQKRPQSEQEKFQPSYECTIMNDISVDLTYAPSTGCYSPEYLRVWPNSPVHIPKYDGILSYANTSPASAASPTTINSVTSTNSPNFKLMDAAMVSPQHIPAEIEDYTFNLMPDSSPTQVTQWLTHHRLTSYITTFAHFSGADIMRMSKDDLIQICGLADGIRMFNILRAKAITPRLTFYVSMDGSNFNAIYLITNTSKELIQKFYKLPGFYELMTKCSNLTLENGSGLSYSNWSMHSKFSGSGSNIFNDVNKSPIYLTGPSNIHVAITDEVLNNEVKDGSLFALEVQNGKIIMTLLSKNDI